MIIEKEKAVKRLNKLYDQQEYDYYARERGIFCPVCNKQIYKYTPPEEWEYSKTKRGSEIFIHTACVKEWSDD